MRKLLTATTESEIKKYKKVNVLPGIIHENRENKFSQEIAIYQLFFKILQFYLKVQGRWTFILSYFFNRHTQNKRGFATGQNDLSFSMLTT